MSQLIQAPDGEIIEFPDGMSDSDIHSEMLKAYGGNNQPGKTSPVAGSGTGSDWLAGVGRNVLAGAGYVASKAGAGLQEAGLGMNRAGVMTTGSSSPWADPSQPLPPAPGPSGTISPGMAPDPVSRYAGAAAQGLTSNPLITALAPEATVGGSLLGEAGSDLAGTPGRVAGSLVGGGLGQVSANLLRGPASLAELASGLGQSKTYSQAGQAIQFSIKDWMATVPDRLGSIYSRIDSIMHGEPIAGSTGESLVPKIPEGPSLASGPPVPAPNFDAAANELLTRPDLGQAAGGVQAAGQSQFTRMLKQFQSDGVISSRGQSAVPLDWDTSRRLSSELGSMIENPGSFAGPSQQDSAKRLYATLLADQRRVVAGTGGNDALMAFDSAQANAQQLYQDQSRLNQYVKPQSNGVPTDPEDAARKALASTTGKGSGGSDLQVLRTHVPDATDELAAAHLNSIDAKAVTPATWAKMAPEAKLALAGPRVGPIDSAVNAMMPNPGVAPTVAAILTGEGGFHLGEALAALHGVNPLLGGASGSAAGMALPFAGYAAKYLANNPRYLGGPLAGLLTNKNVLTGQ